MARTRARKAADGPARSAEAGPYSRPYVGATGSGPCCIRWSIRMGPLWLTLATFAGLPRHCVHRDPQAPPLHAAETRDRWRFGRDAPCSAGTAVHGRGLRRRLCLLFLIIFSRRTPPHVWSLALYRRNEYRRAACRAAGDGRASAPTRRRAHVMLLPCCCSWVSGCVLHAHERVDLSRERGWLFGRPSS